MEKKKLGRPRKGTTPLGNSRNVSVMLDNAQIEQLQEQAYKMGFTSLAPYIRLILKQQLDGEA